MGPASTILHADLDAFYASVEQLLDPSLRGRPIAVGGGVVLAASYEAKRFGVQGGMSGHQARRLCPGLTFVSGHLREYQRLSEAVMAILHDFTPIVEQVSIDEAFLDVVGAVNLFGSPPSIAEQIRARVRAETGLPISIGVASTKHLAKVASQVAKPDGMVVVPPDHEQEFLEPLPVGLIWGVGPVMRQRLADRGIDTIGQLAAVDSTLLESVLGRALGAKVGFLAANDDRRAVEQRRRSSSVGAQSGFGRRSADPAFMREVLAHLSDRVASRLRRSGRAGRTVTVRIRFADMGSITRSRTLGQPVSSTLTVTDIAEALVLGAVTGTDRQISLLAVSVSNLDEQRCLQLELPLGRDCDATDGERPGSPTGAARLAVDHSIDRVRERFGTAAVGYATAVLGRSHSVADEFRELAEHHDPSRP